MRIRIAIGFLLSPLLLLPCACAPSGTTTETTASASVEGGQPASPPASDASPDLTHRYVNSAWNFRIDVTERWSIHHSFSQSYLANGAWKIFAGPDSSGTPVVVLTLPGSNHITDAEIRIGASKHAQALQACTTPPQTARTGTAGDATINGIRFTRFEAGDAAMSHHLDVRAYRVVHDGVCYAIDLLVYGVNPQVYDPPATPPFTDKQAFTRMQMVLKTFRFTR